MKRIIAIMFAVLFLFSCAKPEEPIRTLSGIITVMNETETETTFEISSYKNGCWIGKENHCIFTVPSSLMKDHKDQDCVDIDVTEKDEVKDIRSSTVYYNHPQTLNTLLSFRPVSVLLEVKDYDKDESVLIEDETEIDEILKEIGDITIYEDYIPIMWAGGYGINMTLYDESDKKIECLFAGPDITIDGTTYNCYYNTDNPIHEYLWKRYFE